MPLNFRNVSKPVKGIPTNNNAEIQAATEAIRQAKKLGLFFILTNMKFCVSL